LITVLLVEDNHHDVLLTRRALKKSRFTICLNVVGDGEEAIDHLKQFESKSDENYPDLILLDLNLPKIDGIGVLKFVKADPLLKTIPIIVLTTSTLPDDITKSYEEFANSYITKPINFASFVEIVQKIDDFWFTIIKLPPK